MTTTTRDNILYLTIALAIVGSVAVVYLYQAEHGLPIKFPIAPRPFAAALTTAVAFGYTIKASRNAWSNPRFWIVLFLTFVLFAPLQWLLFGFIRISLPTVQIVAMSELFALLILFEVLLPRR